MRKILISALILICAVTLACGCAPKTPTSSPGGSSANAEISIKSLVVKKMPTKTEYFEGENFDPTGMIIEAVWYDGLSIAEQQEECLLANREQIDAALWAAELGKSWEKLALVLAHEHVAVFEDEDDALVRRLS